MSTLGRKKEEVPIYRKVLLTIEEASAYSNIGQYRIRELTKEKNCDFVFHVGTKTLIKREKFEQFLLGRSVL